MIQRRVWVKGRVQGVGFRMATLKAAQRYSDLRGYVKNLSDGQVEAVFAGADEDVLLMTAWCKTGPSSARIDELKIREEGFDSKLTKFEVR